MVPALRKIIFLAFCSLTGIVVNAQLMAGGGYGTFNIPADPMRGFGPTAKIEYLNGVMSAYWDASYFSKANDAGYTTIYNYDGIPVGAAKTTQYYQYLYNQIGLKAFLFGDFDDKKLLPYLGGGMAVVVETQRLKFKGDPAVSDFIYRKIHLGLHFNAGLQYNLNPVMLELRGNFDLIFRPIGGDDVSNVLTNLRLCVMIPVTQ